MSTQLMYVQNRHIMPYTCFILVYLTNVIMPNSDISITENEQFGASRCKEEN